ncbi:MAG: hypothetical protein FIA90_07240 [candidate division NC10 bacterium]|nr:hypothetical protein [candidate division NC10 bacterium]
MRAAVGEAVTVAGRHPDLGVHLRAWCRVEGHEFRSGEDCGTGHARIVRGPAADQRWCAAERAGRADPQESGAVLDRPSQRRMKPATSPSGCRTSSSICRPFPRWEPR